jgi:hypothetical protein
MSKKETTLNILPVNKTIVFYSPLEGKDVLVRTGTIQDESCFFHALLHGYSKDYIYMDIKDRINYVKKLRLSITKKIDIETWENLSKGIAKISFQEKVNKILSEFYTYIGNSSKECESQTIRKIIKKLFTDSDKKNDIEVYSLITEMLPFDTSFKKNILPNAYKKCIGNISNCKKTIIKVATEFYKKEFDKLLSNSREYKIGKNKISLYLKRLVLLLNEVLYVAENSAYTDYINNLQYSNIDINSNTVQLIADKFNRDIYFIDSDTRLPYINISKENIKKRKSIVIMLTAGSHYEIVGKLIPGNKIIRDFDHKDSIIKTLRTYLHNPEKMHIDYPNLAPFLQKDIKISHNRKNKNRVDYSFLCSSSEDSDEEHRNVRAARNNSSSESSNEEHKNVKVARNNSSSGSSDEEHRNVRAAINNSSSGSSDEEYKVARNNSSSQSSHEEHRNVRVARNNSSSGSSDEEHRNVRVARNNSSSGSSDEEHVRVARNNSSSGSSDEEHVRVARNNSSSRSSSDYEYIKYNKKTVNSCKESDS